MLILGSLRDFMVHCISITLSDINFDLFSVQWRQTNQSVKLEDQWFRSAAYYSAKKMSLMQMRVVELFGVPRNRVGPIMRLKETGNHKNRQDKERKRTAASETKIQETRPFGARQSNSDLPRKNEKFNAEAWSKVGNFSHIGLVDYARTFEMKPWKKKYKRYKLNEDQQVKRLFRSRISMQRRQARDVCPRWEPQSDCSSHEAEDHVCWWKSSKHLSSSILGAHSINPRR